MSELSFDIYENITNMDQNITHYPPEATVLAAACACIFSVVGVVGRLPYTALFIDYVVFTVTDFIGRSTVHAGCPMPDASIRGKRWNTVCLQRRSAVQTMCHILINYISKFYTSLIFHQLVFKTLGSDVSVKWISRYTERIMMRTLMTCFKTNVSETFEKLLLVNACTDVSLHCFINDRHC